MLWIILTLVFGWLLCGAWAIRMDEKDGNKVEDEPWLFYLFGLVGLAIVWFSIWPECIYRFCKGVAKAWREAKE